jgi:hypothetical protein
MYFRSYLDLKFRLKNILSLWSWGQVWHNKDPSLLKDPERQALAYILQPFASNGYVPV